MRHFDHYYVEEVIERLGEIPEDRKPLWGELTRDRLFGHLIDAMRYSMGRTGEPFDDSSWFTRTILGPLIINGILPIPKNVKARGIKDSKPGDLEILHAVMEDYLNLAQADELTPYPHPAFGAIGVDGWAKMHVRHFEHHMKQFGV